MVESHGCAHDTVYFDLRSIATTSWRVVGVSPRLLLLDQTKIVEGGEKKKLGKRGERIEIRPWTSALWTFVLTLQY